MKYNSFEIYGDKFQTRVLQALLTDAAFFESLYDILKSEYFSTDPHRHIHKKIIDLYESLKTIPSYENIKVEFATEEDDTLKKLVFQVLFDAETKFDERAVQQVKEKTYVFCRNKRYEKAIVRSVAHLKEDNFDGIHSELEEAFKETLKIDLGHDYFEQFNLRSTNNVRITIPTGFILDSIEYLQGGLGAGELGVIMAPAGGGKSFFLVNIGYGALINRKNVIHYTFELSETNIGWRYDARITGIPIKEIVVRSTEVQNMLEENSSLMGKLFIKEFPVKRASVHTIKSHVGRLIAAGFKPDIIIVDYADLMKSVRGYEQKRFELEAIYEDLRAIAQELKIPIWTASQTNRSGFNEEIITLDRIGESIAKAQIADFVATFSRTLKDKQKSMGKLFIAKNRLGEADCCFPVHINPSNSLIKVMNKIGLDETDDMIERTLNKAVEEGNAAALAEIYQKYKERTSEDY